MNGDVDNLSCPLPAEPGSDHRMQCMEVWGGSHATRADVTMAGLDVWVYSRPHAGAAAGGDVHYVSSCATGRITRLLVADVTGHGTAVLGAATDLRRLMRRFVNYIDQGRFVREMNGRFAALSSAGNFATAVVCTFYAPTNRLTLCNAGHPPPLIRRAGDDRWTYFEQHAHDWDAVGQPVPSVESDAGSEESPANLPLGILDLGDYDQLEATLGPDDLVLCYTDSLSESADANGGMLGQAGLLRVVNELPPAAPAELLTQLLDRIAALRPGNLDGDDVTTLMFRVNESAGRRVTTKDRLLAPFRVVREVARSIGGRSGDPAPWPQFSVASLGGVVVDALGKVGQRGKPALPGRR